MLVHSRSVDGQHVDLAGPIRQRRVQHLRRHPADFRETIRRDVWQIRESRAPLFREGVVHERGLNQPSWFTKSSNGLDVLLAEWSGRMDDNASIA